MKTLCLIAKAPILVLVLLASILNGQADVLLFENFENGSGTWPGGWTQEDLVPPYLRWYGSSMVHPTGTPYSGENVCRANSYSSHPGDTARMHPIYSIDLSAYAGGYLALSFAMFHDSNSGGNDSLTIQGSLNEGTSWFDIDTYYRYIGGSNRWIVNTIDLSEYAGQANFNIGFLATAGTGNDLYIDDIILTATAVPEPSTWALISMSFISLLRLRTHVAKSF